MIQDSQGTVGSILYMTYLTLVPGAPVSVPGRVLLENWSPSGLELITLHLTCKMVHPIICAPCQKPKQMEDSIKSWLGS